MKLRRILVSTDLSAEAMRPAAAIGALALREGAQVTLVHVVPSLDGLPYGAPLAPPISDPDGPRRRRAAQAALEDQRRAFPDELDVAVVVLEGERIAEVVASYAVEHSFDLVALSTHGRSGIKRFALGSVAEAILRRSAVPVLAFPPAQ